MSLKKMQKGVKTTNIFNLHSSARKIIVTVVPAKNIAISRLLVEAV